MCFNKEVSIITYIIGMVGCIILFMNKKDNFIPHAIFFIWVIHMQLIEFFLWINQKCSNINKNISTVGIVINNLEPIILWLSIMAFSNKILPYWIHIVMGIFIIATIYITTISIKERNCTIKTPESAPHLQWKWNEGKYKSYYYMFFLVVCILLSIFGLSYGYHMGILFFISFVASYFIYGNTHSVGAMWCFIAAFVPLFLPYICMIGNK